MDVSGNRFGILPVALNKKDHKWMDQLCALIRIEKDPEKFAALVGELNELLEKSEYRLHIEVQKRPHE